MGGLLLQAREAIGTGAVSRKCVRSEKMGAKVRGPGALSFGRKKSPSS